MALFDWIPDYGTSRQHKPTVRNVKFGDGYEQRLTYGINTNLQKWGLQFTARTNEEADAIMDFLDDSNAVTAFDWTTPDGISGKKWICRQWSKTMIAYNINDISVEFEEVMA